MTSINKLIYEGQWYNMISIGDLKCKKNIGISSTKKKKKYRYCGSIF